MIVSSPSIYAAPAYSPPEIAATQAPRPAAAREAPVSSAPAPAAGPDEETALRERYFEEMVSSAADLLLRTQSGQGSRFGV